MDNIDEDDNDASSDKEEEQDVAVGSNTGDVVDKDPTENNPSPHCRIVVVSEAPAESDDGDNTSITSASVIASCLAFC